MAPYRELYEDFLSVMNITVIYNPAAGGGREALLCRFVAELERLKAKVTLYHTTGPNDATRYL